MHPLGFAGAEESDQMVPSKVTVPIGLSLNVMVFLLPTAKAVLEQANRMITSRTDNLFIIISSLQKQCRGWLSKRNHSNRSQPDCNQAGKFVRQGSVR